jgi:hypothetical protein
MSIMSIISNLFVSAASLVFIYNETILGNMFERYFSLIPNRVNVSTQTESKHYDDNYMGEKDYTMLFD